MEEERKVGSCENLNFDGNAISSLSGEKGITISSVVLDCNDLPDLVLHDTVVTSISQNEQVDSSTASSYSEVNSGICKESSLPENCSRKQDAFGEHSQKGFRMNLSVSDQGKSFTCSAFNAGLSENCDENLKEICSQNTLIEVSANNKHGRLSTLDPPLTVKKVTSVKNPYLKVKKSKFSCVSENVSDNILVKKYPPVSVRKVIRCGATAGDLGPNVPKVKVFAATKEKTGQHSAQCMKNGSNKCDFVCNLYKSDDWSRVTTQDFLEMPKFRKKKKSSCPIARRIRRSVDSDEDFQHCVCNLCEKVYGWEAMNCLELDVPLPSSFMKPMALLQHFGITLNSPISKREDQNNSSLFNVCQLCYDLLLDSDVLYEKLKLVAKQMRSLWTKQIQDNLTFSFEFEDSSQSDGCQDIKEKEKVSSKSHANSLSDGDNADVLPIAQKLEVPSKLKAKLKNAQRIRSKALTCGLCGDEFYLEEEWHYHLQHHHRVQEKWRNFTPNMHSKFRSLIISEVIKCSKPIRDCNSGKAKKVNKCICCACEDTFSDQDEFIVHLSGYHNMIIDSSLLSVGVEYSRDQSNGDQTWRAEREAFECHQSEGEILEKFSSKVPGNEVHEILPMDNYGNNTLTSEDSLLDSAYCQNVSRDISHNKIGVNEDSDQIGSVQTCNISSSDLVCLICDKSFDTKKTLETHLETSHLSSVVLKSHDESGGVLDCAIDMQDSHSGAHKSLGEDPNLVLGDTGSKTSHILTWESDSLMSNAVLSEDKPTISDSSVDIKKLQRFVYECEFCHQRTRRKRLLYDHLRKIHNMTVNSDNDRYFLYCKSCLFRCKSRLLLEKHMRDKHGKSKETNQQQCETCGKLYSSAYIQEHVAVMHGNERKHTCEFCGMKFFDRKGVKSHIYFEHANKQWKCDKCDTTFKKYHQLRQHMIYVHSTKEFKCEKCGKTYKRKGDLTEHIKRVHENMTLFCNYCPKKYKHPHKFKIHLINDHGLSKEETYSDRYARHKRANNKLTSSEKSSDSKGIPSHSEVQDSCIKLEKKDSEFKLAEVIEGANNDFEMDQVTVFILS